MVGAGRAVLTGSVVGIDALHIVRGTTKCAVAAPTRVKSFTSFTLCASRRAAIYDPNRRHALGLQGSPAGPRGKFFICRGRNAVRECSCSSNHRVELWYL